MSEVFLKRDNDPSIISPQTFPLFCILILYVIETSRSKLRNIQLPLGVFFEAKKDEKKDMLVLKRL